MKTAEAVDHLKSRFSQAILSEVNFLGETTLQVKKEGLHPLLSQLKESGFDVLMDLTGVDYIVPFKRTKVVYWLHNSANYERIRIKIFVERDESLPSVCKLWEGADWYEREIYDLFGVRFEGHHDLKRILMPDDWVGHPLRKDYALTEERVEFKHQAKPKVPSEIILDDQNNENKLF